MQILNIPLGNVPAQRFHIVLGQQECGLNLYTRGQRLFMDLDCGDRRIATGAVCLNHVPVLQSPSRFFQGNFVFSDTRGVDQPGWSGLGDRWKLVYLNG